MRVESWALRASRAAGERSARSWIWSVWEGEMRTVGVVDERAVDVEPDLVFVTMTR
jgi:hypothetical protein